MNHYIFTIKAEDNSGGPETPVAKFFIEIPKLISIYDQEIESYEKYALGKIPDDAPRHTQHSAILEIKEILSKALKNNTNHEFHDNDYVASFSGRLILNQDYSKVRCIKCDEDFNKNDVKFKKWTVGSDLIASGGSAMYCPNDHFLNSVLEWNS